MRDWSRQVTASLGMHGHGRQILDHLPGSASLSDRVALCGTNLARHPTTPDIRPARS